MCNVRVLPVTVDMQQEVGGADGESDLVPQAIGEAVREGLGARLAFEAVVVADLLPHSAALQLKIAAAAREETREVRKKSNTDKMQLKSRGFIIWVMHRIRYMSRFKGALLV